MRLKTSSSNNITANPYNIAEQLYTIYGFGVQGKWSAETALQYIAHSTLSNFQANEEGCADALNYLNQKLEAVRKTISFWDAYQILGAVDNHELLLNKLTQLPNNSSVVNNVKDTFTWYNSITKENEVIYQGDTFLKDYLGNIHVIHAANKGIYEPKTVEFVDNGEAGNSLSIKYEYSTEQKEEVTIHTSGSSAIIPDNDSGYNLRGSLGPTGTNTYIYKFETLRVPRGPTGTPITPVVKYFLEGADGTIIDQVLLDHTCCGPTGVVIDGVTKTGWIIENPTFEYLYFEVR